MKQRYYSVDVAKFAFTLMIAVFHFLIHYGEPARGGFIAVEFFFIVSGFLLMKQWEEHTTEITPAQYTWGKIKKYFPHYIFSFLVLFFYRQIVESGNGLVMTLQNLLHQMSEVFMLHGTILSDEKTQIYNSMTWYISVLLIVGYVLWALLKNHKSAVMTAAPVLVFWIYAYMCYTLGTTNNWRTHVFEIFNYAVLRAVAGILGGGIVYRFYFYKLSASTRKVKSGSYGHILILIGVAILSAVFIFSYKWFHRISFFYIACFAVGILFLTVGEETSKPFAKPVISIANWMSGISYAVYLNHYLVFRVLGHFLPEYHHWIIPIYLMCLIVYSMLTTKLVKHIKKVLGNIPKHMDNIV